MAEPKHRRRSVSPGGAFRSGQTFAGACHNRHVADGPRAVVLAAGRGTRMRSDVPKMLHRLGGRALVLHAVDLATTVTGRVPVAIVPPDHSQLAAVLDGRAVLAVQPTPRGTGDALRWVPTEYRGDDPVLVLSGDVPLVRQSTLRHLLESHVASGAACTLLTVVPPRPGGMGRVVRDAEGRVAAVVEERDLDDRMSAPSECNVGIYAFRAAALWPLLDRLGADNAQGEYYLTDLVALLAPKVASLRLEDPEEAIGINDRCQLAAAEAVLRRRLLEALMLGGVTVEDPATTYVDVDVEVGRDSVLLPMTVLRGATRLGRGCVVGPMAQLRDVVAGDRVHIVAASLEECRLGDDVSVGPYCRVRPGSVLEEGVELGTHAEVKNSRLGPRTRVNHFACVLDSDVGGDVNVGAGTVTCNFDGVHKHRTVVGDGAFLGSDSILVAPLEIGPGAYVAAGSVISRDVPADALAVERTEQRILPQWARRRRQRAATQEVSA